MKKLAKILCTIIICSIVMCSCKQNHTKPVYRAVTQVDVVTKHNHELIRISYNTPEKMRPLLLYLRLLKTEGKPLEPDENSEDLYMICISLSDGTQHYYRQIAHRYVSKNSGPWKAVDPEYAAKFYGILQKFPSDI